MMSENEEQKSRVGNKLTPSYLEVVLIVLIIVAGALYGYDKLYSQKIKVVDMGGYLRQQKVLMTAGEISADEFKEGLNKVDQVISRDAEQNPNQIYVLKEIVLKNGDELNIR